MTPLRLAACRELGQHIIVWCGLALCCMHDYRDDALNPLAPWRRGVFR